jgi:SAM-dependent methyltransferase
MNKENYYIKDGYVHRDSYQYFDDTHNTDNFQNEIYHYAYNLANQNNYNSILDVGCGSGYKLLKYFGQKQITGIDEQPTIDFLSEKYPNNNWLNLDEFYNSYEESNDLILSVDVIEHILNPNVLLEKLKKLQFKKLIISTPDRDLLSKLHVYPNNYDTQAGPPHNKAHIREWNKEEFIRYISDYFEVEDHLCLVQWNQFVVCRHQGEK